MAVFIILCIEELGKKGRRNNGTEKTGTIQTRKKNKQKIQYRYSICILAYYAPTCTCLVLMYGMEKRGTK